MMNLNKRLSEEEAVAIVNVLRPLMPNSNGITTECILGLHDSGILRDMCDVTAVHNPERVRNALRLDQVMTRVSREIEVNYDLTPLAMLSRMIDQTATRTLEHPVRTLVWDTIGADTWMKTYPAQGSGKQNVVVETVRFDVNVGGERVLVELDRAGLEFAGYEHLFAFLTHNARRLDTKRPLIITRREFVNASMRPEKHLHLAWLDQHSAVLRVPTDYESDPYRHLGSTRWGGADILVVKKPTSRKSEDWIGMRQRS